MYVSTPVLIYASLPHSLSLFFFFNDTATTEIYTLSLHDALPIYRAVQGQVVGQLDGRLRRARRRRGAQRHRSEEHTSELQSHSDLVCRLLLEKKKKQNRKLSYEILNMQE